MRENAKKWITLKCDGCQKDFQKELKEYERQIRRVGQKEFFCGHGCLGNFQSNGRTDELSPFRAIYRNTVKGCKNKGFELDFEVGYLKEIWDRQNGICPYTGIKMILPKNISEVIKDLSAASLDRCDSNQGYVKGNVEFVCRFVNLGKNNYPKEEVKEFIGKIRK